MMNDMDLVTSQTLNLSYGSSDTGPYNVISREVFITLGIVFAIVGMTGSVFLIFICSFDQALRRSSKHFLLVITAILCILEQCLGAFIVHTHMNNIDILVVYGCEVSYFISAASYISISVIILLVAAIAFDTVLSLCVKPSTAPSIRMCIAMEWVGIIVVGSALILLPLMNVNAYNTTCSVYMMYHYMVVLNIIHFLPQVLILILADLVLYMCYTRKQGKRPDDDIPLPFPKDIYIASALVILLKFPDFIFSFGFNICSSEEGSCNGMYIFWVVATYLSTAIYVLMPFVWLTGRDTRQGAARILAYCRCCGTNYRQDIYILTSPEPV